MKRNLAVFFSGRVLDYEINNEWIKIFKTHFENDFNINYFCSINSKLDDYHKEFLKIYNIQDGCYHFEKYVLNKTLQNKNVNPNMFSMFYNNKKCVQLIENSSTQYDVILRYRTEVCYKIPFKIPDVITPNTIYIPNNYDWGGINDQIAYGDLESMKTYTELYDNILNYNQNYNIRIHPETLLKYHLQKTKMNIVRFEFNYSLIKKANYRDQIKYKISDPDQYKIIEDLERELVMYKKYNIEQNMKIDLFKLTIFNLQKQLKEKSNQINSSQTNETGNYTDKEKQQIIEENEDMVDQEKQQIIEENKDITDQEKQQIIEENKDVVSQEKQQIIEENEVITYQEKHKIIEENKDIVDQEKQQIIEENEDIVDQEKQQIEKQEDITDQEKQQIIEENEDMVYQEKHKIIEENKNSVVQEIQQIIEKNKDIVNQRKQQIIGEKENTVNQDKYKIIEYRKKIKNKKYI
jgi:hypothetical protein